MTNIWTNGCFDILHIGHIKLFEYAKSLGDVLYVGIDSDERIKKAKGDDRPINDQETRRSILLSIKYIDSIDIFYSNENLVDLIKKYKIDTIVVGDDYKDKTVLGSDCADVIFFPKIQNISTTKIISTIWDR